ncbi:MAG: hypothetical protein QOE90_128 [Thermoplasmata archaeon]|jgi:hypothetical protein|nr:hypothetical protein [Thermoplasmata archaeon]
MGKPKRPRTKQSLHHPKLPRQVQARDVEGDVNDECHGNTDGVTEGSGAVLHNPRVVAVYWDDAFEPGHWSTIRLGHQLVHVGGDQVLDWVPSSGQYRVWRYDPGVRNGDPFPGEPLASGKWSSIKAGHELIWLGTDRVLDWVPATGDYRVWAYDSTQAQGDPLPGVPITSGAWQSIRTGHKLVSLGGNHVLDWVPATGEFRVWRYDPTVTSGDPFLGPLTSGRWETIRAGHFLVHLGGDAVLDWEPATGDYRIWRYDRATTSGDPFPGDPVTSGRWGTIRTGHRLVYLGGDAVLDWEPATGTYRIWRYDRTVTRGDPFPGDPIDAARSQAASDFDGFFRYLVGSPWRAGLAQYGVGEARFEGSFVVRDPHPKKLSESDVQDRLTAWLDSGAVAPRPASSETDLLYVIVTPRETEITLGDLSSKRNLGGYHSWGHYRKLLGKSNLFFAVVPMRGSLANTSGLLCHEMAEAFTDRSGNGWTGAHGCEIGDLCEQEGNAPRDGYVLQRYWSNVDRTCIFGHADPFPGDPQTEGVWGSIRDGHELVYLGGDRVLDWEPFTGNYRIWAYDRSVTNGDPFPGSPVTAGQWTTIRLGHKLIYLGGDRVLDWEPASGNYRVWRYDRSVTNGDPFPGNPVTAGQWSTIRGNHELAYLGNDHVLDWEPDPFFGRCRIWRYDRSVTHGDPFVPASPLVDHGWSTIRTGHELIPLGGDTVLDWVADNGWYRIWRYDPGVTGSGDPFPGDPLVRGQWHTIRGRHRLIDLEGDRVLDWDPSTGGYRIWRYDRSVRY